MMSRILAIVLMLLYATVTWGAEPCEDQLRSLRIYAEHLNRTRQRVELDAAQTVSELAKKVETLQSQVDLLLKQKDQGK